MTNRQIKQQAVKSSLALRRGRMNKRNMVKAQVFSERMQRKIDKENAKKAGAK